jgi:hypothetical protein
MTIAHWGVKKVVANVSKEDVRIFLATFRNHGFQQADRVTNVLISLREMADILRSKMNTQPASRNGDGAAELVRRRTRYACPSPASSCSRRRR